MDGTVRECQNFATILNKYCAVTGQAINLNKLEIYSNDGLPLNLRRNVVQELRVLIIGKIGKYLGIPSNWGQLKKYVCVDISKN